MRQTNFNRNFLYHKSLLPDPKNLLIIRLAVQCLIHWTTKYLLVKVNIPCNRLESPHGGYRYSSTLS
jgi:hypothetical protein